MIKGTIYEKDYDYEYDGNIHKLLYLMSKVSYLEVCKRNIYKDNGYLLVKNFKEEIKQCYNIVKDEIDELFSTVKKEERLEKIKDLRTIFKSKKIDLKRESENKVSYVDNSLDEKFFYQYINTLKGYIDKMLFYLKELRTYYKSLESEYIESKMALCNIFQRSTELQPVGFYQYLVTKTGFNDFYNRFKPSDEEMSANDMAYDEDKLVITYNIFTNDEVGCSYTAKSITFNDFILRALKSESYKTLLLIKAKFEVSGSENEFSFYLKRNINYLKTIIGKPSETEEEYFKLIKEQVNKLIKNLQQEYKSYLILTNGRNEELQCFFKLKGDKSELRDKAINLHNRLCKNGFLKEESKKMFVDLFIGKKISEKIIWNKPKNQLKLFVDLLLKYEKIEGSVKKKGANTSSNFIFLDQLVPDKFFSNTEYPKDKSKMIEIVSEI